MNSFPPALSQHLPSVPPANMECQPVVASGFSVPTRAHIANTSVPPPPFFNSLVPPPPSTNQHGFHATQPTQYVQVIVAAFISAFIYPCIFLKHHFHV